MPDMSSIVPVTKKAYLNGPFQGPLKPKAKDHSPKRMEPLLVGLIELIAALYLATFWISSTCSLRSSI